MKKFNFIILCIPEGKEVSDDELDNLLQDIPDADIWDADTKDFDAVIKSIKKEYKITRNKK